MLRFLRQIFSQGFKLTLLEPKHRVASATLSVDSLGLLDTQALFGGKKLLHGLRTEPNQQLVQFSLKQVNILLLSLGII